MEIEEIRQRLSQQDNLLKEILLAVKGSVSMGIEGLLPTVIKLEESMNQMVKDVAHLQRWKQKVIENKGKFTISFSVLLTRFLTIIGGLGTIVAIALGVIKLIDWLKK